MYVGFPRGTGLTGWRYRNRFVAQHALHDEVNQSTPTIAVSHQKDQEPSTCSVHKAGCLSCPSLELKAQRIPGEQLVISPCWKPRESGSSVNGGSSSSGNKADELASKSEDKQAKRLSSFISFIWATTGRWHLILEGVFPLQII